MSRESSNIVIQNAGEGEGTHRPVTVGSSKSLEEGEKERLSPSQRINIIDKNDSSKPTKSKSNGAADGVIILPLADVAPHQNNDDNAHGGKETNRKDALICESEDTSKHAPKRFSSPSATPNTNDEDDAKEKQNGDTSTKIFEIKSTHDGDSNCDSDESIELNKVGEIASVIYGKEAIEKDDILTNSVIPYDDQLEKVDENNYTVEEHKENLAGASTKVKEEESNLFELVSTEIEERPAGDGIDRETTVPIEEVNDYLARKRNTSVSVGLGHENEKSDLFNHDKAIALSSSNTDIVITTIKIEDAGISNSTDANSLNIDASCASPKIKQEDHTNNDHEKNNEQKKREENLPQFMSDQIPPRSNSTETHFSSGCNPTVMIKNEETNCDILIPAKIHNSLKTSERNKGSKYVHDNNEEESLSQNSDSSFFTSNDDDTTATKTQLSIEALPDEVISNGKRIHYKSAAISEPDLVRPDEVLSKNVSRIVGRKTEKFSTSFKNFNHGRRKGHILGDIISNTPKTKINPQNSKWAAQEKIRKQKSVRKRRYSDSSFFTSSEEDQEEEIDLRAGNTSKNMGSSVCNFPCERDHLRLPKNNSSSNQNNFTPPRYHQQQGISTEINKKKTSTVTPSRKSENVNPSRGQQQLMPLSKQLAFLPQVSPPLPPYNFKRTANGPDNFLMASPNRHGHANIPNHWNQFRQHPPIPCIPPPPCVGHLYHPTQFSQVPPIPYPTKPSHSFSTQSTLPQYPIMTIPPPSTTRFSPGPNYAVRHGPPFLLNPPPGPPMQYLPSAFPSPPPEYLKKNKQDKHDKEWYTFFDSLVYYKNKFGTYRVDPAIDPILSKWFHKQCEDYFSKTSPQKVELKSKSKIDTCEKPGAPMMRLNWRRALESIGCMDYATKMEHLGASVSGKPIMNNTTEKEHLRASGSGILNMDKAPKTKDLRASGICKTRTINSADITPDSITNDINKARGETKKVKRHVKMKGKKKKKKKKKTKIVPSSDSSYLSSDEDYVPTANVRKEVRATWKSSRRRSSRWIHDNDNDNDDCQEEEKAKEEGGKCRKGRKKGKTKKQK